MSLFQTIRHYVCQISRGKVLQIVTLLTISLLTVNWYIFGNGRVWSYNTVDTANSTLITILGNGRLWTYPTVLPDSTKTIRTERTEPTTNSPSISTKTIRTEPEEPTTNSHSICPKLSLQPKNRATYGLCSPHKPSEASCKFTQDIYALKPELVKCKKKGAGDVCKMNSKGSEISFRCNPILCQQGKRDSFKVHSVDPNTGLASIVNEFSTSMALERGLPAIVIKNKQNKLNFVFIECTSRQGEQVSQFLPIEPDFTIDKTETARNRGLINVVVLLIDSIARAHFYRSLPRTIATFKNWRENPGSVPAKVFDFELFQALHGHTAENTQALFTGNVFPSELKGKTPSVNMSAIFGHYKRAGYHTMYQEDLCWKGIWGLMIDLGVRQWNDLQGKMKTTFIDHTGLTHSSCKILESLGVTTPFSGPEGDQICYNGKFQHSYFLRYTTDTLHAIDKSHNARPLFSYTSLSVAHDHRSIRTQTMDIELESYVTAMAKENTLTIILADHGNTYTRYTSDVLEGRFEMFHPSLFVIVPDRVAALLGEKAMSALAENQQRLVTMIDLHRSLMVLANPLSGNVKPVGLFTPIALNRTCDDLELRLPNLCVCEGWDVPADNDTSRIPIAEFAIGQLNNRLAEQSQNSKQRSCQRLQPLWFENVRERNSKTDRSLITSMDVRVKAGDVVPQKQDIFHVEVMTRQIIGQRSLEMTLVSFDRLTLFGKYAECADDGVDLKLCVCSQSAKKTEPKMAPPSTEGWTHFGQRPIITKLYNTKCLWLITWSFEKNTSNGYEVANFCYGRTYRVTIDVEDASNIKFSRELPLTLDVKPGNVQFAFSIRKHISYWDGAIKVVTKVETKLKK